MRMSKKVLQTLGTAVFWLAVWFGAAAAVGSEVLLPSPTQTLRALADLLQTATFYKSVVFSVLRLSLGYVAGVTAGVLFGALTYRFAALRTLFAPLISGVKATPVASFIILLFVWFSNGTVAAVTSSLIVLPIIWSAVFTALGEVDGQLLEMARVFGVPKRRVLAKIVVPSVRPSFKGAAATAMGLCWKAGIAAEVICSPKNSIGAGLYDAKIYLDIPSLFAWTLVVVLVSVMLEKLLVKLVLRNKKGAAK